MISARRKVHLNYIVITTGLLLLLIGIQLFMILQKRGVQQLKEVALYMTQTVIIM